MVSKAPWERPLVSIGLPVYNGEGFIRETIDSLLAQTFENFELIISDNASEDATDDICRYYASRDPRIHYLRNEKNLGAAKNYNLVFFASAGKYFKWSACDDLCAPQFLEKCVEALERRPEVVLAYTRSRIIDGNGRQAEAREDELQLDSLDVPTRFTQTLSAMKVCQNPFMGVIRRGVLARTRLNGAYLASDRCLVAELILYGPFYQIPEVLFSRRLHSHSISASREWLDFFDPSLKGKIVMPEWRVAREHALSVSTTPLSVGVKARLYGAVLRWMFDKRVVLFKQLVVAAKLWLKSGLPGAASPRRGVVSATKEVTL
jgi:glycosyltransferase involved in cell wall biosynthesis